MKYFILLALLPFVAHAADMPSDDYHYCDYTKEKSEAERLNFESPSLLVGGGRTNTGSNNAIGVGVTESLSKFLQGRLSNQIGDNDCRLYRLVNNITKHVQYDLIRLTYQDAETRVNLTEQAILSLDSMIVDEQKRVEAGGSTIMLVATLQAAKARLTLGLGQLQQQMAVAILPTTSQGPLKDILKEAVVLTEDQQAVLAKQSKYQNWDLALTVGAGSNPSMPMFHSLPTEPYVSLSYTYSFGGPARNRALDRAASSYAAYARENEIGPINLGWKLSDQIRKAKAADENSFQAITDYNKQLAKNVDSVAGTDTVVAHMFRVSLAVEQLTYNIEANALAQSIERLNNYMEANFNAN
jgi:hypothetical protein